MPGLIRDTLGSAVFCAGLMSFALYGGELIVWVLTWR
jgi:hypothetical protein